MIRFKSTVAFLAVAIAVGVCLPVAHADAPKKADKKAAAKVSTTTLLISGMR